MKFAVSGVFVSLTEIANRAETGKLKFTFKMLNLRFSGSNETLGHTPL